MQPMPGLISNNGWILSQTACHIMFFFVWGLKMRESATTPPYNFQSKSLKGLFLRGEHLEWNKMKRVPNYFQTFHQGFNSSSYPISTSRQNSALQPLNSILITYWETSNFRLCSLYRCPLVRKIATIYALSQQESLAYPLAK